MVGLLHPWAAFIHGPSSSTGRLHPWASSSKKAFFHPKKAFFIQKRPSSSNTGLLHPENAFFIHKQPKLRRTQLGEAALLGVVQLGALDDDGVGGQVDAPGQRGRGAQHLEHALTKTAAPSGLRSLRSMPAWWMPMPAGETAPAAPCTADEEDASGFRVEGLWVRV